MTTAGNLVDRTVQELLAGTVEERNKLASSVSSSDTTLTLSYALGSLRENSVFEIESELMYVWEANSTSKTVTVERGFGGTTAASHSAGAIATVNPRFPRNQVLTALNTELSDLSSPMNGLYQIKTTTVNYNGSDRMVNLPSVTSMIDLYDVRFRYLSDDWPVIRSVRVLRDMPTSDFASGFALAFDENLMSGTYRVIYKDKFGSFTNEASTVASVGASTELEDLLVLGAQVRVMSGREVKRNFTESQGDTRRAEEVPAGAVTNSINNLLRLRRDRIQAEAARLARLYPLRIRK